MTKSNKSNDNKPKTNKSNTPLPEVKPATEDTKPTPVEEVKHTKEAVEIAKALNNSQKLHPKAFIVTGLGILLAIAGFVLGYSISHNSYLNTSSGVAVTANETSIDYGSVLKEALRNQQARVFVQQAIVGTVFEKNHANLTSDKEVDKEIERVKKEYGDNFQSIIKSSGFDDASFRTYTKQGLIMRKFVESKVNPTDKELKQAYDNFVPDQEVEIAVFATKKDAEDFKKAPTDKKFAENIEKVTLGTNNNTRNLSNTVLEKAYSTKQGEYSDIFEENDNQNNNGKLYVVVKSVKHNDKGSYDKVKSELKKSIVKTKSSDADFASDTMKAELKRLNIKYNDKDIKNAMKDAFDTTKNAQSQTPE